MDVPYFIKNTSGWMLLMRQHSKKFLVEVNPPQSWPWNQKCYHSGCYDDFWSCEQLKNHVADSCFEKTLDFEP